MSNSCSDVKNVLVIVNNTDTGQLHVTFGIAKALCNPGLLIRFQSQGPEPTDCFWASPRTAAVGRLLTDDNGLVKGAILVGQVSFFVGRKFDASALRLKYF